MGQVTLSIGIAVAGEGESLERLMERADAALYSAKRAGRNRIERAHD
jgi:diguanylate cyclase (GGDEF)-like protein